MKLRVLLRDMSPLRAVVFVVMALAGCARDATRVDIPAEPPPGPGAAVGPPPTQVGSGAPAPPYPELWDRCAGGDNALFLVGEPGAYVVESAITVRAGAGWTQDVEAAQSGLPSYVTFHAGNNWSVSLSTDSLGKPLDVGAYENAQRAPFTDPNRPGLAVSGDGRGCNEVGGSFRIHAIRLGGRPNDGRVVHIRATFEQLCEGKPPAVRGCLQYSEPGAGGGS